MKYLTRIPNSPIAGVCAGLGKYFSLDPAWIRILFCLGLFFGEGIGVLIYVIFWMATPEEETTPPTIEDESV
jgi:phage shock protein PspC (stress-responsive transcriptional regulator)